MRPRADPPARGHAACQRGQDGTWGGVAGWAGRRGGERVGVAGGVAGRPAGRTQTPAVHTMMLFLGGPYILKFHRVFNNTKQIFTLRC